MNERLLREIDQLRRYLDDLASVNDDELVKYELFKPPMPPGLYWKVRWLGGRVARWLESVSIKKPDPWPAGLKQIPGSQRAKPLLIWAVGTEPAILRAVCQAFAAAQRSLGGFVPVLVTDVADFAFFSRMGWLVEYLPNLSGEDKPYAERKARFVARLYRSAPALPATPALVQVSGEDVCRWLAQSAGQG